MRTLSGDAHAHARGHVAAGADARVGYELPVLGRLHFGVQLGVGEQLLVERRPDDVPDLPRELEGQRDVIRAGDDLVGRVVPEEPRREQLGGDLGLPVPRGHEDHEARGLLVPHVLRELLQALADVVVDPPRLVSRVEALDELDELAALKLPAGQLLVDGVGRHFDRLDDRSLDRLALAGDAGVLHTGQPLLGHLADLGLQHLLLPALLSFLLDVRVLDVRAALPAGLLTVLEGPVVLRLLALGARLEDRHPLPP